MRRFKLKTYGNPYWYWVIVHDTVKDMREGCRKHATETGETTSFTKAFGVCHTYKRYIDGTDQLYGNVGIIRLAKTHLRTSIVSHEVVHAAAHLYRLDGNGRMTLGPSCDEREEKFAYMYDALFDEMNWQLHKRGYWSA